MDICLLHEFTSDRFACAAFKEHVIRHDDRRATMLLEDREDMLEEVELLVAGTRPEVIPADDKTFLLLLP